MRANINQGDGIVGYVGVTGTDMSMCRATFGYVRSSTQVQTFLTKGSSFTSGGTVKGTRQDTVDATDPARREGPNYLFFRRDGSFGVASTVADNMYSPPTCTAATTALLAVATKGTGNDRELVWKSVTPSSVATSYSSFVIW
jgi:hypothetical protein